MSDSYYKIEEMNGYYRIGSPEAVFCYVIVGKEKAMLIDTGHGYGNLKQVVKSITDKPLYIVNTHGHLDHTSGNAQFEEKVYIHKKDMELCREHTGKMMREQSVERAMHSVNYETQEEYNALPDKFDKENYINQGTGNLVEVAGDQIFDLGGATLEIVETPGHTQGGISVWYKEKKLAFTGDTTGFFVWLFAPETTSREIYIDTLNRLLKLPVDFYIGGHNENVMTKEDLELYMRAAKEADFEKGQKFESFANGEEEVRVCALDGKSLDDMFEPGFAALVITKDK